MLLQHKKNGISMCGIIGVTSTSNIQEHILNSLKRLEYRGYDSSGIATILNKKIHICKSEGKIQNLTDKLLDKPIGGVIGIGHTRWATHGSVSEINAHPHISGNVAIVHNGIIENFQEIRNKLQSKGRTFLSETDSEVIAHLFESYLRDDDISLEQITMNVLKELEGTYAFVVMILNFPDLYKLFFEKENPELQPLIGRVAIPGFLF